MKRILLMAWAAAFMCGCEKPVLDDANGEAWEEKSQDSGAKSAVFNREVSL